MFVTAFRVLFFIKLSSSSSFNLIYKIINTHYKIALALKTIKLKVHMPSCIISGKQFYGRQIPQLIAKLPFP